MQQRDPNRKYIPEFRLNKQQIRKKNFSGRATPYSPEGQRSFLLLLDEDKAKELSDLGYNVKLFNDVREEGDPPQAFMTIKVRFDKYPPEIWAVYPDVKRQLHEDTIGLLDGEVIESVDIVVTPSFWQMGAKSGYTAYVKKMYAKISEDEMDARYRNVPETLKDDFEGDAE